MNSNLSDSGEYVQVYTAYGQLAGEMVRLLLESQKIPARLLQESAGASLGLTFGALGEVHILVPLKFMDEAREILRALEEGRLEEPYYYTDYTHSGRYNHNKQTKDEDFTKHS